jgi:hypothetical protein
MQKILLVINQVVNESGGFFVATKAKVLEFNTTKYSNRDKRNVLHL